MKYARSVELLPAANVSAGNVHAAVEGEEGWGSREG